MTLLNKRYKIIVSIGGTLSRKKYKWRSNTQKRKGKKLTMRKGRSATPLTNGTFIMGI